MAMSIKGGPILYGVEAENFYKDTLKNSRNPSPELPEEIKRQISDFLDASKKFDIDSLLNG